MPSFRVPKPVWVALSMVVVVAAVQAAETYQVDAVHSSVLFHVKHMNVSYSNGRFNDMSGTFNLDDKTPSRSVFDFRISAASLDTAQAKRDLHLKGPDFFNVQQFPYITFKSTKVAKSGDGTYDVEGDLTLHGVTRPLSLKVAQTGSASNPKMGRLLGLETVFTIKRSDFGMNNMLNMVGDEVRVTVDIEARGR